MRRRSVVRLALVSVALVLGVSTVWVGLATVDAIRGDRALRSAREEISGGGEHTVVAERIERAHDHFSTASAKLRGPLAAPLRFVPLIGQQVSALIRMSTGAAQVSEITGDAIAELPALTSPKGAGDRVEFAKRVAVTAARTSERLEAVDIGGRSWLLTPVAKQYDRFSAELEQLRSTASRGAVVAKQLTPFLRGPRTYLVLAANNAEMRAGQGMFLSAGAMHVEDGGFSLDEMTPTATMRVERGAVPVRGDMKDLWGSLHPGEEWRNLGLSPRFDTAAPLAAAMWKARTGSSVDGVLAVDAVALQALLRSVGPARVDGKTVDAEGAVKYVLHDQYIGVPLTDEARAERRDGLADLAGQAVDALDAGGWQPTALLSDLGRAASGRHILAWSPHKAERAMWSAAGLSGRLGDDSLLVSVLNRGGNKLDQFLDVRSELSIEPGDRGSQDATLRVRIRNTTPKGEPPYIAGPHPLSGSKAGQYLGILAVTLPGAARDAHIDGVDELTPGGRDGPTVVVGTPIDLVRDQTETLVVRFTLPDSARQVTIEPSGRVPATRWTFGDHRWSDEVARQQVW